jgi:TPR repeat protein
MENLSIDELFDKATKYMEEGKKQEAFNYLIVAADLGHIPAAHNLAGSYYKGDCCIKNMEMAFKYWKIAADAGFNFSQENISNLYFHGAGVKQNIKKAIEYCNMAASTGHPEAIKNLTNLYNTVSNDFK